MDRLEIIFAFLSFIGVGTVITCYKKIRNNYIRKSHQNKVMFLFIIMLVLLMTSSILLLNKWTNLAQCQNNASSLLTENKGLKIDLEKIDESKNLMNIEDWYVEFGNDVLTFEPNQEYNLTLKIKSKETVDVWISSYAKPVSIDDKIKPNIYVIEDYRNVKLEKDILTSVPMVLNTKDVRGDKYSMFYACIRVIDSSKRKQGLPSVAQENCENSFTIR